MSAYNHQQVVDESRAIFRDRHGRKPRFIVSAPGRVNLIGEHVDYNDGFVMPLAIERRVVIAADVIEGNSAASIWSSYTRESVELLMDAGSPGVKGWSSYVQGVLAGFLGRGAKIPGFEAVIHSDIPAGGGLSSSAALEVATATLIEALTDEAIPPVEKALLCQRAEHEFAGVPCGFMDQFASIFGREGRLVMIDCRSRDFDYIRLGEECGSILITDSRVSHDLKDGAYARRREECRQAAQSLDVESLRDADLGLLESKRSVLPELIFKRARHVITETQRTCDLAEALKSRDVESVGRLMYESHASLRDDYEVSCSEIDFLVELSHEMGRDSGVIGTRITGGGFGGCCVSLVETDAVDEVSGRIASAYRKKTGIVPAQFVTRPAMGAEILLSPQTTT